MTLLEEKKGNGKAQFRIVYFSQNAREFKHYDFETEANVAGEVLIAGLLVKRSQLSFNKFKRPCHQKD